MRANIYNYLCFALGFIVVEDYFTTIYFNDDRILVYGMRQPIVFEKRPGATIKKIVCKSYPNKTIIKPFKILIE